jgi:HSP20 family protein
MTRLARRPSQPAAVAERWDPARELGDLHQQMERIMGEILTGSVSGDGAMWVPAVDIEETDDAWVVEAEIPGAKRKDVNVEVHENELVVAGEIKEKERTGVLRRRTRRVGQFEYRVTLPGEVDADGIDASLDDGVLTVRVPKPERTQPRRVEVGSSANGQH